MTYTELLAAFSAWLHRTDVDAQFPTIVQLAEARLNRELNLLAFSTIATLTVPAAATSVALPTDFKEARSLVGASDTWTQRSPEQLTQMRAAGTTDASFAVLGGSLHIVNAPDADLDLTLTYWRRIPSLVDNSTNWLSENYPDVYLFATLAEAVAIARDQSDIQLFEARRKAAVDGARAQELSGAYFAGAITADYVV